MRYLPEYPRLYEMFGRPIETFVPGDDPPDPSLLIRVRVDTELDPNGGFDDLSLADRFAALLDAVDPVELSGLVVGASLMTEEDPGQPGEEVLDLLCAHGPRLPNVDSLVVAHLTPLEELDEGEHVTVPFRRVLDAFPRVRHLAYRGLDRADLTGLESRPLDTFVFQAGGDTMYWFWDEAREGRLPDVTTLELGSIGFGWECNRRDDVAVALEANPLPRLRRLAFDHFSHPKEVLPALLESNLLDRLEALSLAGSPIDDEWGEPLLEAVRGRPLGKLDVSQCALSPLMVARFRELDLELLASDQQRPPGIPPEAWGEV